MGHSGKRRPLPPGPEDLDIEEIARSLSHLCRFTGHVKTYYSVAEHSVRVSLMVSPEHALWGLLHDVSEAFLGDVSTPLKNHPNMRGYKALEALTMKAVIERFKLPWEMPEEVHFADQLSGCQEGTLLVPNWPVRSSSGPPIHCWGPDKARDEFLRRYYEVCAKV